MELSLSIDILRHIEQLPGGGNVSLPVLYIFVPLAMIEIVNRRWGAWQSGFMGSSPPSPPLALQHHRLTVFQNFERIFQHIFQWDRGGVALRKSFCFV